MTDVVIVGLSHHTAPIEVRERLSLATSSIGDELQRVLGEGGIAEGLLLSTCNRVEFYGAGQNPQRAIADLRQYLQGRIPELKVEQCLYERSGDDAVHHAFRVASSLDSMVVGEPQILGQVKEAYQAADQAGAIGPHLTQCFSRAFATAKRVRNETGIAEGAVSVSSVAIELAAKIFGSMKRRRVLLVGAGEMSEAAAKALTGRGAQLVVVNRSAEKAERLAEACGGKAKDYDQLPAQLAEADITITSTASPRFIITRDLMRGVVKARRRRPLFLIDIAVPRDVDPRAGDMENVFLYDVDDLQKVAAENKSARTQEANAAEALVRAELRSFASWKKKLVLKPTIVGLREQMSVIIRAELERTVPRLENLSEADRKTLDKMANSLVNKILHAPLSELKSASDSPDAALLIDATRRLFRLPDTPPEEAPEPEREAEPIAAPLAASRSGGQS